MNTRNLTLLASLALLAGCGTAPAPQAPQDSTKFTVENTVRFAALDPATEAAVSCTGLQERALADGRLEVVANLRNGDSGPFRVQVQCAFLDDQGLPVGAAAPWRDLEIGSNSTEVVRFTADVLAAKKYSIRVRTAR